MKSIFVIVGAVAAGYVAHKFAGKHGDAAVSKAHEVLKKAVKREPAAEVAVEAEVVA
jgi:hypothetical protein